jgi:hypothetical protein
MSASGDAGATPVVARFLRVMPPSTSAPSFSSAERLTKWHERPSGSEDFAERQFLGEGVQLVVIGGDADHVKPHHLGGALNERRVALFKPRAVRSAVNIDAEHHDNRHFISHAGEPPVMSGCEHRDRSAQRGTMNITRT